GVDSHQALLADCHWPCCSSSRGSCVGASKPTALFANSVPEKLFMTQIAGHVVGEQCQSPAVGLLMNDGAVAGQPAYRRTRAISLDGSPSARSLSRISS